MLRSTSFLTITALVLGSACGISDAIGGVEARCDLRPKTPQCTDWRGAHAPSIPSIKALCAALGTTGGGTYGDSTCDKTDMLGGCEGTFTDGSKQTNWFYKSDKYADVAAAQKECSSGTTFVSPN